MKLGWRVAAAPSRAAVGVLLLALSVIVGLAGAGVLPKPAVQVTVARLCLCGEVV